MEFRARYLRANTFNGLTAGPYQVVVKDANNCLSPAQTVTVAQPLVVSFTAVPSPASCNGASDGSIVVTASGGTGTYQYSKDNGASYQSVHTLSALAAGPYQVVVKDANNCLSPAQTVTVAQPLVVSFTAVPSPASCNGASDGSIVVTASGGTGTYQYSKDNGASYQSGNTFNGLTAGPYQVVVKDANNCLSVVKTIAANEPALLVVGGSAETVSCNGGSTTLTASASGGTSPYQYSLDGVTYQAGTSFTVNAGFYTGTVKDANGCRATSQAITVIEMAPLS